MCFLGFVNHTNFPVIYLNFPFHARGTNLAEFLTDGDPEDDLRKTVQELEEYDPKAVKLCRTLATNYSKQLFEIYKNKEDPLFLP